LVWPSVASVLRRVHPRLRSRGSLFDRGQRLPRPVGFDRGRLDGDVLRPRVRRGSGRNCRDHLSTWGRWPKARDTMKDDKDSLADTFELKGHWWLPETPNRKIPGVLVYSPGEIQLELLGVLRDENAFNSLAADILQADEPAPFIYGNVGRGGYCTLKDCLRDDLNIPINSPDLATSTWVADNLFVGVHFATDADIRFLSWALEFSQLEDWLADMPFKPERFQLRKGKVVGRCLFYAQCQLCDRTIPRLTGRRCPRESMARPINSPTHGQQACAMRSGERAETFSAWLRGAELREHRHGSQS
jgi:hypothetical protein